MELGSIILPKAQLPGKIIHVSDSVEGPSGCLQTGQFRKAITNDTTGHHSHHPIYGELPNQFAQI